MVISSNLSSIVQNLKNKKSNCNNQNIIDVKYLEKKNFF